MTTSPRINEAVRKGELFDGSATSELPHDINDMGQFGFNEPLNIYICLVSFISGVKYDPFPTFLATGLN